LFLFALFMRRRGLYRHEAGLVRGAFVLMGLALVKVFIFDLRAAGRDLLCSGALGLPCDENGWLAVQVLGFAALAIGGYLIAQGFARFSPKKWPALPAVPGASARGQASLGMIMVVLMIVWQLGPWVFSLSIGHVPDIFTVVTWQPVALVTAAVLLAGFWAVEGCPDYFPRTGGAGERRGRDNWLPRDSLWLAVFLYAFTLALSYVAHDVLSS
jgi:hypothetical protein